MNRKIAGMVRLLLPVFLLTGLSVNIQAVAAADTEVVPAGRSNGAMTMSGLVQTGTCSLSADNTTMNFKPMDVNYIQTMGSGSTVDSFDTVLNLNNCMGNKLKITLTSFNQLGGNGNYAYLANNSAPGYKGLFYTVQITVDSGFCLPNPIRGDTCSSGSVGAPLDGRTVVISPYYQPDSNSYRMKLTTTIISPLTEDSIPVGIYAGYYSYNVTYQ
ncbi:hypothetical protein RYW84_004416 [Salmonella enterica]|uniref:Type 1 fimbrial protein n=1 Tax=Salmonella enterica TaxID=28901 RepID=A0A747SFE4_SALER|nr:hypothetical protein [Salmonella enterica]EBW3178515.1 hypothetical protein [Salmonella enterica subsp. enterica serovar Javiana]EDX4102423.1 hypothetical protein [Salmonella enterica]EJI2433588.1 hypothetical protein [Salmonella enterica]ELM3230297.1 hypothetical protein [Salmonella enterica]